MKQTDRRIRRTRRLLRNACVALILEQGYEAVTVEAIAERADVGRTTFYMHYRDKADLFVRSIRRISEELYEEVAPLIFSREGIIEETPVLMIFQHAAANADLYRVILQGAGNGRGLRQLHQDLCRYTRRVFEAEATALNLKPAYPIEIITQHFVGSLLSLIQWWLDEDQPRSPENMTEMLRELTNHGRILVVGMKPKDVHERGLDSGLHRIR